MYQQKGFHGRQAKKEISVVKLKVREGEHDTCLRYGPMVKPATSSSPDNGVTFIIGNFYGALLRS
jgi:hypothetical protein